MFNTLNSIVTRLILTLLAFQNFIFAFFLIIGDQNNLSDQTSDQWIVLAFRLDVVGYILLFIISIILILKTTNWQRTNWILIAVGSILFIYATLVWRTTLDFYPEKYLGFLTAGVLVPDDPNISGFEAIGFIINALRVSNTGLLLVSIGLYREDPNSSRYLIITYGVLNSLFVFVGGVFLLLKLFTVYLAAPYFLYVAIKGDFPVFDEYELIDLYPDDPVPAKKL